MNVAIGSVDVGTVGLGTAGFAFNDISEDRAFATVAAALAAGVVMFDTALAYSRPGVESYAERVLGDALRAMDARQAVVATKGGHWRDGDEFPVDGRPRTLRRHCEISLRNLGRDHIDLYLLHHVDPAVALEESAGALQELRTAGLVRSVGLSNVTGQQLDRAIIEGPIAAVQNRLSVAHPGDAILARDCEQRGIAYMAYQPVDGGGAVPASVSGIARRRAVSPQQVMLAWVIARGTNVVPIVGASRPETIEDSARAADIELTETELEELGA